MINIFYAIIFGLISFFALLGFMLIIGSFLFRKENYTMLDTGVPFYHEIPKEVSKQETELNSTLEAIEDSIVPEDVTPIELSASPVVNDIGDLNDYLLEKDKVHKVRMRKKHRRMKR